MLSDPHTEVTEIGLKTQARLTLSHKATETPARLGFVLKAQTRAKTGPNTYLYEFWVRLLYTESSRQAKAT